MSGTLKLPNLDPVHEPKYHPFHLPADSTYSLEPGESKSFTVTALYDGAGTKTNRVIPAFHSEDVTLRARFEWATPECRTEPAGLDFGTVPLREERMDTVMVFNVGEYPFTGNVESIILGPFRVLDTSLGEFILQPGESLPIRVWMKGSVPGDYVATLRIRPCAAIPLRVNIPEPPPIRRVTPDTLDLGRVAIGDSLRDGFVLQNVGGGLLQGTLSVPCGDFSIPDRSPQYSIPGGELRTYGIQYRPTHEGTDTCRVSLGTPGDSHLVVIATGYYPVGDEGPRFGIRAASPPSAPVQDFYYELAEPAGRVRMEVFDVAGRRVASIGGLPGSSGRHLVRWNAAGRSNGVYFVRLVAGESSIGIKVVLVR